MNLASQSDQEILDIATPIMDNLMEGSTEIDHAKHTRDFSERLKGIVTKEHLENVCRRYQAEWGYFSRREGIAVFRRPSSVAIIWRNGALNRKVNLSLRWSLSRRVRDIW